MTTIDADKSRVPIWLLWELRTNGNRVLRGIFLSRTMANGWRKRLAGKDIVRVWMEPIEANHLYAEVFTLTGASEIRRVAQQLARSEKGKGR